MPTLQKLVNEFWVLLTGGFDRPVCSLSGGSVGNIASVNRTDAFRSFGKGPRLGALGVFSSTKSAADSETTQKMKVAR